MTLGKMLTLDSNNERGGRSTAPLFLSNQTTLYLSFDMKKTITICILSIILGMIAGFVAGHSVATSELVKYLEAYDAYNKATEELLDTLDNQYDWVDAFDPYDYYDYRAKLDSLLYKE